MAKFEAVKKITVTEQILDQIATLITSGELKPGEQLPNERELAIQLGVTRGRVREALRALSLVGMITIKAGEGSFVSRVEAPLPGETIVWMFHNELHRLDEVFAARKLIESEVYFVAAECMSREELDEANRMLHEFASRCHNGEPEQLLDMLDKLDLYVAERCGNRIFAKLMQTVVHLRRETNLRLLAVPGAARNGAEGRIRVLKAMRTGDPAKTRTAVERFFASSLEFLQSIGK